MPKLKIHVKNPVPFGRGLGSSATAIVAGVRGVCGCGLVFVGVCVRAHVCVSVFMRASVSVSVSVSVS